MRNLNLDESILNEYLLDDFNIEDSSIIGNELEKRLSGYDVRELEIGCGNGKFIVELAMNNKDKYFIGIEYSYKAAKKAVSKAYKRNIKNLTIIFGEANNIIDKYLNGKYYFDKIYLNFPDPWPKKKHAHRRIFTKDFLKKMYPLLKDEGIFYSVTDDDNYALEIMNPIYQEADNFKNILDNDYVHKLEGYGVTLYEEKMRAIGHNIYFFAHSKNI
ncbi:tRNA (guanosine(46)-N7)-methyltransferase TrmB [Brachyspira hyodysenteriae]|uniref:tRNA (guanine-N(7)-)-methyltransferase n=1 Tax=Brachyspira hyodysenteriae ATCC 27164 TaxID=1266923 RepID=A0A3B6VVP8_BRAHO|nr:tRNA (guanosine(46)-N7)-methyltransferase TrmB [Brachyspira hyodysenteriae]ANN63759.1 tRNA (guanosine(46)-N7)-methyltransferase TrmB [Brachyspira hyodysenteriae ATCC 27164]AUJ49864.1 tRNA (guanine-N(7)-)-methyltransferase [Brachyspira hyodysenteriae]KLI16632.1 tRNA (guanine-N7)-methyltransferase [Brachyspira hyodysenteriae]KLI18457.1 tRNA (guanine-N7)-methyltransferase [Brachyspira hyodysenteriae]KLI19083.1 tRNA (guanine-N7)-methyltransferase [Brachyspira hyodysenteriae]